MEGAERLLLHVVDILGFLVLHDVLDLGLQRVEVEGVLAALLGNLHNSFFVCWVAHVKTLILSRSGHGLLKITVPHVQFVVLQGSVGALLVEGVEVCLGDWNL